LIQHVGAIPLPLMLRAWIQAQLGKIPWFSTKMTDLQQTQAHLQVPMPYSVSLVQYVGKLISMIQFDAPMLWLYQ
jgi:hypothetical protein